MAKAIVTPDDLDNFAEILKRNIEEFNTIESSMNTKLNSYDWRDNVAVRFKTQFEATKEPLNKLRQIMTEFIPHLNQKAATLRSGYQS